MTYKKVAIGGNFGIMVKHGNKLSVGPESGTTREVLLSRLAALLGSALKLHHETFLSLKR